MGLPCVISHELSTYERQQAAAARYEAGLSALTDEIKTAIQSGDKYRISNSWAMSADDVLTEVVDEHNGITAVCALLLEGKLSDSTAGMQLRFMLQAALNKLAIEAAQQVMGGRHAN